MTKQKNKEQFMNFHQVDPATDANAQPGAQGAADPGILLN